MKMFMFDGTPAEIGEVLRGIQPGVGLKAYQSEPTTEANSPITERTSEDSPRRFVTDEFARRVLTRLPVSEPMKAVLKALLPTGENWTPMTELCRLTGYSKAQFSGLMGAFGRRMAHTENFDQDAYFFDYQWSEQLHSWEYRLPNQVADAIRAVDLF
jgi:hypothetical protein